MLAVAGGGALLSLLALAALTFTLLRPQRAPAEALATDSLADDPAPLALPTPVLAARVVPAAPPGAGDGSGEGSLDGQPPLIALGDGREIALKAWDGQSRFTMLIAGSGPAAERDWPGPSAPIR